MLVTRCALRLPCPLTPTELWLQRARDTRLLCRPCSLASNGPERAGSEWNMHRRRMINCVPSKSDCVSSTKINWEKGACAGRTAGQSVSQPVVSTTGHAFVPHRLVDRPFLNETAATCRSHQLGTYDPLRSFLRAKRSRLILILLTERRRRTGKRLSTGPLKPPPKSGRIFSYSSCCHCPLLRWAFEMCHRMPN